MRLIDADELKTAFPCGEYIRTESVRATIDHMPTIEPERKKGKWIFLDECSNSGYYCSECNKKVVKEGWSNTVKKINFCPNCGADMRRVSDHVPTMKEFIEANVGK